MQFLHIFTTIGHERSDELGSKLRTLGTWSFTVATAALGSAIYVQHRGWELLGWPLYDALVSLAVLGFLLGLAVLVMFLINHLGREKGKTSLAGSGRHVLGRVFLFMILPAVVLTIVLIVWAVATDQPIFEDRATPR